MTKINLVSGEGEKIEVDLQVALHCGHIKKLVGNVKDGKVKMVHLPNVKTATLRKILDWVDHHKNESKPGDKPIKSSWDMEYLNLDRDNLQKIVLAAAYLEVKDLFHIASELLAKGNKAKTTKKTK